MESNFKMLAKTFYGMEGLLAEELKNMGAQDVEEGNRVVHFAGDKGLHCLHLRSRGAAAARPFSGVRLLHTS